MSIKVKFTVDSGGNLHSARESKWFTLDELGIPRREWDLLTDKDKMNIAQEWANENIEIYYEEREDNYEQ